MPYLPMHHTPAGEGTLEDSNICLVNLLLPSAWYMPVQPAKTHFHQSKNSRACLLYATHWLDTFDELLLIISLQSTSPHYYKISSWTFT
jgi:hypothetical protein